MSIGFFLQNPTYIQCFFPCVWATETPEKAAEKNGTKKKKKKKKVGNPNGEPRRGRDAPIIHKREIGRGSGRERVWGVVGGWFSIKLPGIGPLVVFLFFFFFFFCCFFFTIIDTINTRVAGPLSVDEDDCTASYGPIF